ncbi:lipopolysaccharide transport periplasmic protein LptA [Hahella aquimaris]|uniref:lipopolysaccharide transport periplasmic protein LptA n=1 Tax=Hahella sp. HNIBRBA332 TaxID=3015983 RepID=UPI00273CB8AF|nr:lipopolysaccharide transport periplasmic protein LptA [Hahella sp. HNIBRBA332]WLQ14588.1 lipopolysaccharide transport periplasmic protein LptA [Hahella sp. HNIBRBA332]
MHNPSKLFTVALLLGFIFAPLSHALDLLNGSDEPVRIKAGRWERDGQKGIDTYIGNVVITQGKSSIEADKVILYTDDNGISRFQATGKPAHLVQFDEEKQTETHAYAENMDYDRSQSKVVMRNHARILQDNSSVEGEEIIYFTDKRLVTAKGASSGNQTEQVEIIYHPPKSNKQ